MTDDGRIAPSNLPNLPHDVEGLLTEQFERSSRALFDFVDQRFFYVTNYRNLVGEWERREFRPGLNKALILQQKPALSFLKNDREWFSYARKSENPLSEKQLKRAYRHEPLRLFKALEVIVGANIAIREIGREKQYKSPDGFGSNLRLLPAVYFIAGFDEAALEELEARRRGDMAELLAHAGQTGDRVLADLARGRTVTRQTAERFAEYLRIDLPRHRIGPATPANEDRRKTRSLTGASLHEIIELETMSLPNYPTGPRPVPSPGEAAP